MLKEKGEFTCVEKEKDEKSRRQSNTEKNSDERRFAVGVGDRGGEGG